MLAAMCSTSGVRLLSLGLWLFGLGACAEVGSAEDEAITRRIGLAFAEHLVAGRFEQAHQLLAPELASSWTPEKLKASYQGMIGDGAGPIVVPGHTEHLARWPDRRDQDHGWIYVSITGTGFAEAVTVVVTDRGGAARIRQLEWGRP